MEHITLYRKWRPQTFGEVVGQRHVTNTLANALSSGRIVHAYLFAGPRGTGKTSTARILAKAVNCVEGPTASPCNVCEACVSISDGTALDVIEIDAASNRKIDEIRDLLDKIPYTPTSLRSKVYIIDEVHQLTPEASSALLKTLEEPPGHVIFVLATTEPHKLLPTIVSRCQRFDFTLVSAQEMEGLLEHIASREDIDIETEALEMIAEHAHGSVRDAIGVMDQISNLTGERVTKRQLAELLGEVETELVFEMVDFLAERDTKGALNLIGRLIDDGKDPRRFVESLVTHLRNLFLIQNAANPEEIVEATADHFARLTGQSEMLSRHEVIKLIERLGDAHREMRWSENPRLVLECAVVKNTSLDADISLEGLAFRIEELERRMQSLGGAVEGVEGPGAVGPRAGGRKPAAADATRGDALEGGAVEPPGARVMEEEVAKPPASADIEAAAVSSIEPSSGSPHAASSEREKVRRAWMAVMGELKKMGRMKLYALLTKARVKGLEAGSLVLGFPEDAVFQMEVLRESRDDIGAIEDTWKRIVGESVKVELSSLAGEPGRTAEKSSPSGEAEGAPGQPSETTDAAPAAPKPPDSKGRKAPAKKKPAPAKAKPKPAKAKTKKSSSREIAQILKERFDGEIVEDKREGKD